MLESRGKGGIIEKKPSALIGRGFFVAFGHEAPAIAERANTQVIRQVL
jgi:hypothetical protein